MTNDYASVRDAVVAWHLERFPHAQAPMVTLKACEEMGELASAVLGAGNVPEEAADVAIALMVLIGRWYQGFDLLAEVEKKLTKMTDPASTHRASLASGQSPTFQRWLRSEEGMKLETREKAAGGSGGRVADA